MSWSLNLPRLFLFLLACSLVHGVATASAQAVVEPVGRIKSATGETTIMRAGQTLSATIGTDVFESDQLRTGSDGRLGITLRDETRVALGPNSDLTLAQFAFAPEAGRLALGLRLARGALSYVSGVIAKLAPAAVRIQTPTAVIGVRGTHVLIKAEAP